MAFTDDVSDRVLDVVGRIGRTVLAPWGGAQACLDTYETTVRAITDAQMSAARAIHLEPVRSALASSAHLTRDISAAQLSALRWILDV